MKRLGEGIGKRTWLHNSVQPLNCVPIDSIRGETTLGGYELDFGNTQFVSGVFIDPNLIHEYQRGK